ncbi:MurR/RpiR family transcriptional regulator [Mesorhizobium sp.]|uniref:MurR/RpiR family transcriptional regulator n=1 Tax=Mesorhizobium sp. TaxID=1871066 RepID=UPI000FD38510|nr:MurR/RpiR family transcriptional regulator [Mesorhizobium sp.]RVC63950.1 MurR/RpiR family transcriptional regulator [Mesorhizobium sp. M4B.F.Ca.ET.088.02.2.1]RVD71488.1 MurR/RpiR family transcriptional regulator [Mesorhizobium sp. M4A.F.Ca.ET.029.04.2.1]RWF25265.1 MAG: MurR/RpiR family transcriptional regulator [Mesorhizobium sp.]RWL02841.1 MAG: MurR/RpiR family transcriptional regulator [Mesorhizobium sp.]
MDPTLRTRIISDLKDRLGSLPGRSRIVAKYIVDHPSDFGLDTIRETAFKAGVSTYTLVRLADRLGFGSYDAMREPFRHALVSVSAGFDHPEWIKRLRESGGLGQVQADASLNALAIVQRSLELQDPEQLQRVVTMLLEARSVYLTAVRASYSMAYYFYYVGRMALPTLQLIPRHMNSAIDDLHSAGEDDVMIAITFNPYSRETIDACKFARRRGVKLILISDSVLVSPDFSSDETIIVSVLSTHHFGCYAGSTALLDMLVALLVAGGSETATARIRSYEDLRRENQVYWVAPKKR